MQMLGYNMQDKNISTKKQLKSNNELDSAKCI